MRTFICPDGLVIVLDKVTHIEHAKQDGYKEDSPWRFTVHFVGGGHTQFPLDHENRMYDRGYGKMGYQIFRLVDVGRVRDELIAALTESGSGPSGPPQTPYHPGLGS